MSQRLNNLNKITSTLWGGAEFYRKASRKTDKPQHEEVFQRHAELREENARELARLIDEAGGEPVGAASAEQVRSITASITTMFNDTDQTFINALEEHEDRTLAVLREVLHHPDNQRDEQMLRAMYEQFEASHAQMREWKTAA